MGVRSFTSEGTYRDGKRDESGTRARIGEVGKWSKEHAGDEGKVEEGGLNK